MKVAFLSSVEVGYNTLHNLLDKGFRFDCLLSLHQSKEEVTSGWINFQELANEFQIPHKAIRNINSEGTRKTLSSLDLDLLIVCGWQRLLKPETLAIPRYGCVGFHASFLPDYRGRAPVNWAIIEDARKTGVSCFYLDPEPDSGDLLAQVSFPIDYEDTVATIYEKVSEGCSEILEELLPKFESGPVAGKPNPARNSKIYPGRKPEDGEIYLKWKTKQIYNMVRAVTRPYPGAYLRVEGKSLRIWSCREGKVDGALQYPCANGWISFLEYEWE